MLRAFEVDASEVVVGDRIGEGGQAVVLQGTFRGVSVAIKQPKQAIELKKKKGNSRGYSSAMDSFKQALRREIRALSRVRHPNVVRLIGACFDDEMAMVLMAYAPSGTLQV